MQKLGFFAFSLFLLSLPRMARADAVVSVGTENVFSGSLFSVPVSISGVSDLYDYQFDLAFDPTILQLQSVKEDSFLSSAGTTFFFPGLIDNTAGTVAFVADSLIGPVAGASGGGTLADLNFWTISVGSSALTLSSVILQDQLGNDIPFTTSAGRVSVANVPEPGLLWPLPVLLCALVVSRRRRASA